MPDPTRWRVTKRLTFAAAGSQDVYAPADPGDVLNVRQLTISSEDAAEIVAYYGAADADRLNDQKAVAGLFLAANGGASPDMSCLGAWAPSPGMKLRVYASAACDVWITVAGVVE